LSFAQALAVKPIKRKYESDDEETTKKHPSEKSDMSPEDVSSSDDDDDDDDDDDECASEEIYDASDEPFPIHAAFDPGLKHITATASKLVQEAHNILKKHASKSTTLQNMQKNAEETLIPPKSDPPMIAFVGPTGEGMLI
jgi:ABC-type Zn2+ transport system substrate-binding protein/surface adhesin